MPKAGTETAEAVKRAPRKRAVRRVVSKDDAPVRRRTRAATSRSVESEPTVGRKAPAYVRQSNTPSSSRKFLIPLLGFVLVVGVASWIGFSDAGQINVTERINTSNQDAADVVSQEPGGSGESVTVPVQNTPPAAISGLQPRTDGGGQRESVPPPVEEMATTTEEGEDEGSPATDSGEADTTDIVEEVPTVVTTPEASQ
jgi:hypothetical protein